MNGLHPLRHDPLAVLPEDPGRASKTREDWEDWDSDYDKEDRHSHDETRYSGKSPLLSPPPGPARNIHTRSEALTSFASSPYSQSPTTPSPTVTTIPRTSTPKPPRLKSRARQKAQNAKAGIRLVTDISNMRKQQQAQQFTDSQVDSRMGKFVDAAALRALEGKPSDTSIGSFHWLKRKGNGSEVSLPTGQRDIQSGTPSTTEPYGRDLSPNDAPIVIGISLPESDLVGRAISPNTATVETPAHRSGLPTLFPDPGKQHPAAGPSTQQTLGSVWSPDTEYDSPVSPYITSSIYLHQTPVAMKKDDLPVPSVPSPYLHRLKPNSVSPGGLLPMYSSRTMDDYDDDIGTPITLFEEDGTSEDRRGSRAKGSTRSIANTIGTARTRSGWWDHVRTPFIEHPARPLSTNAVSPTTPYYQKSPLSPTPIDETAQTMPPIVTTTRESVLIQSASVQIPETNTTSTVREWWEPTKNEKQTHVETPYKKSVDVKPASTGEVRACPTPPIASASFPSPAMSVSPHDAHRGGNLQHARVQTPADTHHANWTSSSPQLRNESSTLDAPPPYEPPAKPEVAVRYHAVFPPGHHMRANFPPSPGPVSPGLANTMTSQGGIQMSEVPLTPVGVRRAASAAGTPLPLQPHAPYIPGGIPYSSSAAAVKAERTRRRHEKEEVILRRAGNLWRGRGCVPQNGCFGRPGREGRKRRRICVGVVGLALGIVTLVIVLAVTLTQRGGHGANPYSFWLNTTTFPPVPTGVTTIVGTDNVISVTGCVKPQTLWSCSLPKEQQKANQPFSGDQPSFALQIQFDNSSQALWNLPDGRIPTPTSVVAGQSTGSAIATTAATSTYSFDNGFTPQPQPPSFQEMWFLGNTTDGIVSDRKAGEPTPFYITFLSSVNATTPGPNKVVSRHSDDDGIGNLVLHNLSSGNSSTFPAPTLNADGTGASAVMHPLPLQQPMRLYDRGLSTEHFGFYTYFNKTIYVRSIKSGTNNTDDSDGGVVEAEASYIVTWMQVRFLVQIWTNMSNTTKMIGVSSATGTSAATNTTQPGTFPYPVTITEDLHGGDFNQKGNFARMVDSQQHIELANATSILADLTFGGTLINHGTNPSFGGFDGGSGGCKCSWTNFVGVNGNTT